MSYFDIFKVLGCILLGFAAILLLPLAVAIYYHYIVQVGVNTTNSTIPFLQTIAITLLLGILFYSLGRKASGTLLTKEWLVLLVMSWLLIPVLGALPFWLSDTLKNPYQAYFEAVSALSTTGATVIEAKHFEASGKNEIPYQIRFNNERNVSYSYFGNVEPIRDPQNNNIILSGLSAVDKGLLFWRSFMQWVGGMSMIMLFASLWPALRIGSKDIQRFYLDRVRKDFIIPEINRDTLQLGLVYCCLTVAQFSLLILMSSKIDWFDSLTLSFSTISTGGMTNYSDSLAAITTPALEWIVMLFMFLASLNLSWFLVVLRGNIYRLYNFELISYIILLLLASSIVIWFLLSAPTYLLSGEIKQLDRADAIRHGLFQMVSAQTTTGFSIINYDHWPNFLQTGMFVLTWVGGMFGSAAGGIKMFRLIVLMVVIQNVVEILFRPHKIPQKNEIDNWTKAIAVSLFIIMIFVAVFATLLYIFDGIDQQTAIGCVGCMINNSGLEFHVPSLTQSFAFLSDFSLMLSSLLMIMGRLEFFAFIALLFPSFWKRSY